MTIEITVLCDGNNCRNMADIRADNNDAVKEAGFSVDADGNHYCIDCASKKRLEASKVSNQAAAPDAGDVADNNQ